MNFKRKVDLDDLLVLLRCPDCRESNLKHDSNSQQVHCDSCSNFYPMTPRGPAMLSRSNSLFKLDDFTKACVSSKNNQSVFSSFIPSPSINMCRNRVLTHMRHLLKQLPSAKVLVVGGGNQRLWLEDLFKEESDFYIVFSDIDVAADVDLYCDGHNLTFIDNSFDAVITTAVLEHVLYPEKVSSEIYRVLKPEGLLYSELPFIQQVHEGAYDFTRYTHSGHRRLFNCFDMIESGMTAGPGTALVWSIENFVLAFIVNSFLRKVSKAFTRICFFWIKYTDLILANRPEAMDGASCTYFFGRKLEVQVSDEKIISGYIGAKHLSHT